jgi:4-methylaminobutanoate oxidase (formaldehyde-forming)
VIKFDKPGGFIGRDALLAQQEQGVSRHLVQLKLNDPEPLIYHNEPIWRGDEIVGHITSAAYGHTLAGAVGLGYVSAEPGATADSVLEDTYEVEVAGERFSAEVSLQPLYDPDNAKVRR